MNDNDLKFDSSNNDVYRATTNLNTALEDPQVNINSAIGVNIQNSDNDIVTNIVDGESRAAVENNPQLAFENSFINNQNMASIDNVDVQNSFDNVNTNVQDSFVDTQIQNNNSFESPNNQFIINNQEVSNLNNNVSFSSSANYDESVLNNSVQEKVKYEPIVKNKNKKTSSSETEASKELKAMAFIVFILVMFILVIPYIYDFFAELELVITAR